VIVFVVAMYAMIMDTIPSLIEYYTAKWDKAMRLGDAVMKMANDAEEANAAVAHTTLNINKGASKENEKSEVDELDVQIERLFLRYDLDGSGTINSWDELEQLCCNLGYRLELDLLPAQIDEIIDGVKAANDSIEWDLPTFTLWFKEKFSLNK
jgi:hypothetical protein